VINSTIQVFTTFIDYSQKKPTPYDVKVFELNNNVLTFSDSIYVINYTYDDVNAVLEAMSVLGLDRIGVLVCNNKLAYGDDKEVPASIAAKKARKCYLKKVHSKLGLMQERNDSSYPRKSAPPYPRNSPLHKLSMT
jgi:hypothetical protein